MYEWVLTKSAKTELNKISVLDIFPKFHMPQTFYCVYIIEIMITVWDIVICPRQMTKNAMIPTLCNSHKD